MRTPAFLFLLFLVAAAPAVGQSLYGVDGSNALVWEFTLAPGPPCNQPNGVAAPCNYTVPAPCPNPPPPPGPFGPPPNEIGDIAVDSLTDTYFVTDGLVIEEYMARGPCGLPPPCTPINAFFPPSFMAAISGMGMDELGAITGSRTLWLTDGMLLVGVRPSAPGTCAPPVVTWGPCPLPVPGYVGDCTWDPRTGTIWVCDFTGLITQIFLLPGGTCQPGISFPPPVCGLSNILTGIAYDLATPDAVTGGPGALFVTDGGIVEYVDVFGGPAFPTFYAPVTCSGTPAPLNGLAYNANAITFGTSWNNAKLTSYGQSSSPGPTFGLELTGSPAANAWLILRFNVYPMPNYFCPPLTALGVNFWVNPGNPAILINVGVLPNACTPIPLPLPGAVPPGVQGYVQFVYMTNPPAVDATNGLAFTIGAP